MFNAHAGEICRGWICSTQLSYCLELLCLVYLSITSLCQLWESSILNGYPFASKLQFSFFFL